jgi:hypothetical protein
MSLKMEKFTQEIFQKEKKMDLEHTYMKMETDMRETGFQT